VFRLHVLSPRSHWRVPCRPLTHAQTPPTTGVLTLSVFQDAPQTHANPAAARTGKAHQKPLANPGIGKRAMQSLRRSRTCSGQISMPSLFVCVPWIKQWHSPLLKWANPNPLP
jgi:hypothetical protein